MLWSWKQDGRWMEFCYLCGGFVTEEVCSLEERHYACTRTWCAAHYRLYLLEPSQKRKKGVFACCVIARHDALREALRGYLYEEVFARCAACSSVFLEKGDGTLRCPNKNCGTSAEFYFETLLPPFVAFIAVVRIPEPGFSEMILRHLNPQHVN